MTSSDTGNFVSEWFGYRVYPVVQGGTQAITQQSSESCPFLSWATGETRQCVKAAGSKGVCTLSSASNGYRQDWLACPYRALDKGLVGHFVQRLFGSHGDLPPLLAPVPTIARDDVREQIRSQLHAGGTAFVYFQDKLGGEISVPATPRSPEFSFDVTVVELVSNSEHLTVGRFGVVEIQTMDFHGSYRSAVTNLKDALRLHPDNFAEMITSNPRWLSERIEGPNIANVFKRTFYQMMLKFRAGVHPDCVGTVLALPDAVWDSWQRFLGRPDLIAKPNGEYELRRDEPTDAPTAWILTFDADLTESPNLLRPTRSIAIDAESLSHFALAVVPETAFAYGGAGTGVMTGIRRRLGAWWPELITPSS